MTDNTDKIPMIKNPFTTLRWRSLVVASLVLGGAGINALAQNAPPSGPGTEAPAAARPQASPGQPAHAIGAEQALYLVRSTLLTLNDANRSGNYTVLRDLAAPDFQAKNTAADLAQSFADLRRRNFDLFAVALIAPTFTTPIFLDANGRAHLTGLFPTRPLQISFDLTFQSVGGQWRLFTIAVATLAAPTTQSQINRPDVNRATQRRPQGLFYGFRVLSGDLGWRF